MARKPKIQSKGRLDFRLTIADVDLCDFVRRTAKAEHREVNQQIVHMVKVAADKLKENATNG